MTDLKGDDRFSIRKTEQGLLVFSGELTVSMLEGVRARIEKEIEENGYIELSLEDVGFIDTAAVQLLLVATREFGEKGSLRIVALSEQVKKILDLLGIEKEEIIGGMIDEKTCSHCG